MLQLCHISDPNPVKHLWVELEQVLSTDDPLSTMPLVHLIWLPVIKTLGVKIKCII